MDRRQFQAHATWVIPTCPGWLLQPVLAELLKDLWGAKELQSQFLGCWCCFATSFFSSLGVCHFTSQMSAKPGSPTLPAKGENNFPSLHNVICLRTLCVDICMQVHIHTQHSLLEHSMIYNKCVLWICWLRAMLETSGCGVWSLLLLHPKSTMHTHFLI